MYILFIEPIHIFRSDNRSYWKISRLICLRLVVTMFEWKMEILIDFHDKKKREAKQQLSNKFIHKLKHIYTYTLTQTHSWKWIFSFQQSIVDEISSSFHLLFIFPFELFFIFFVIDFGHAGVTVAIWNNRIQLPLTTSFPTHIFVSFIRHKPPDRYT